MDVLTFEDCRALQRCINQRIADVTELKEGAALYSWELDLQGFDMELKELADLAGKVDQLTAAAYERL